MSHIVIYKYICICITYRLLLNQQRGNYMVYTVREAQHKLSELLRHVEAGEEVFIRRGSVYFSVKKTDVIVKEAE